MSAEIKINEEENSCQICGVLNFSTVPGLRNYGNKIISQYPQVVFDFGQVTRSDSAGLALLTAWWRFAGELGKKIRFVNIPNQMIDIARLSNLDKILTLGE